MSVIEAGSSGVPSRLRNVMSIERRALKACTVSDSPLAGLASVGDRAGLAVGADDHELLGLGEVQAGRCVELSEKLPPRKRTVTRPVAGTSPVNE